MPYLKYILLTVLAVFTVVSSATAATYQIRSNSAYVCLRDTTSGPPSPACSRITSEVAREWDRVESLSRRHWTSCSGKFQTNPAGNRLVKVTASCYRYIKLSGGRQRVLDRGTAVFTVNGRGRGTLNS